jgi:hypothetical protein
VTPSNARWRPGGEARIRASQEDAAEQAAAADGAGLLASLGGPGPRQTVTLGGYNATMVIVIPTSQGDVEWRRSSDSLMQEWGWSSSTRAVFGTHARRAAPAVIIPEVEGVFVPFDAEESWLRLSAHFEGPKYRGSGAMRGLDDEDAIFIESVLREGRIDVPLVVDRSHLKDSHEAWVHVLIQGEAELLPLASGFGPYPRQGVLTWPNSD